MLAVKRTGIVLVAMVAAMSIDAKPVVSGVSVRHIPKSRYVKIDYTLNEEAYVTVDIRVGGESIGGENFSAGMSGAVNRLVSAGPQTISWNSRATWPEHAVANMQVEVTAWPKDYPPDYLVLDLTGAKQNRYYASADQVPGGVTSRLYKKDYLLMKKVHAAAKSFVRGSMNNGTIDGTEYPVTPVSDPYAHWREYSFEVTLTNDFYMGVYEVTQGQYRNLGLDLPAACPGTGETDSDYRPVGGLSFASIRGEINDNDKQNYHSLGENGPLGRFRTTTGLPIVDLPTESEWEFACRAGSATPLYGDRWATTNALDEIAWWAHNAGGAPHEVGLKEPNAWGFYDMLGNVTEFPFDWYKESLSDEPKIAPFYPAKSSLSTVTTRGGSFASGLSHCRCPARCGNNGSAEHPANWASGNAMYGFRVIVPIFHSL